MRTVSFSFAEKAGGVNVKMAMTPKNTLRITAVFKKQSTGCGKIFPRDENF
jgi:hypothetical protein